MKQTKIYPIVIILVLLFLLACSIVTPLPVNDNTDAHMYTSGYKRAAQIHTAPEVTVGGKAQRWEP